MNAVATKTQKQVQVIARIEIKKNGIVVYQVRSSNGVDTYNVTVVRGKVNNCTCPAKKPCYHMVQLQARENERKQQEAEAVFRSLATSTAPKLSDAEASDYFMSLVKQEPVVIVVPTIECALCHRPHQAAMLVACDTCGKRVCVQCCTGPMSATCRVCEQPVRLSREAYNDEFSPNYIPGMY